LLLCHNYRLN